MIELTILASQGWCSGVTNKVHTSLRQREEGIGAIFVNGDDEASVGFDGTSRKISTHLTQSQNYHIWVNENKYETTFEFLGSQDLKKNNKFSAILLMYQLCF